MINGFILKHLFHDDDDTFNLVLLGDGITSVNNGEKIVDKLCDKGLFGLSCTWKERRDEMRDPLKTSTTHLLPRPLASPVSFRAQRALLPRSETYLGPSPG